MKDPALRFAARVLETQPDPPRQVSFSDVLTTRIRLLLLVPVVGAVLALASALRTGSPTRGGPPNFAALGLLVIALLVGLIVWVLRDTFNILCALRNGVRMTGQVYSVGPPSSRFGQSGSVRLQMNSHMVEKLFKWSGEPLEYEDSVQVLVDPDPSKEWVALLLGPAAGDGRLPR